MSNTNNSSQQQPVQAPDPANSKLELSAFEKTEWLDYGTTGRTMNITPQEAQAILQSTDPALADFRERVQKAMTISDFERDAYILASRMSREGELEFDPNATVSVGSDNGAYVSSWMWVDFSGTPLDVDVDADVADESGLDDDADIQVRAPRP